MIRPLEKVPIYPEATMCFPERTRMALQTIREERRRGSNGSNQRSSYSKPRGWNSGQGLI